METTYVFPNDRSIGSDPPVSSGGPCKDRLWVQQFHGHDAFVRTRHSDDDGDSIFIDRHTHALLLCLEQRVTRRRRKAHRNQSDNDHPPRPRCHHLGTWSNSARGAGPRASRRSRSPALELIGSHGRKATPPLPHFGSAKVLRHSTHLFHRIARRLSTGSRLSGRMASEPGLHLFLERASAVPIPPVKGTLEELGAQSRLVGTINSLRMSEPLAVLGLQLIDQPRATE